MSAKKHKLNNSSESDDSLSDLDSPPPSKKKSDVKKSSTSTDSKVKYTTNSDGDKMLDLTGKKFVCVRQFKGRVFVDIREYYEDKSSGDLKPGKKGISLNVEQWDFLKGLMDDVDRDIVNVHR